MRWCCNESSNIRINIDKNDEIEHTGVCFKDQEKQEQQWKDTVVKLYIVFLEAVP